MAGDLVLIVLKIKLIVICQLEREEGTIKASSPEEVGKGAGLGIEEERAARSLTERCFLLPPLLWGFAGWR